MSRVAKQPVKIIQGVQYEASADVLTVKGPKGQLQLSINPLIKLESSESEILVKPADASKKAQVMSGTFRSLINNMVTGVSAGFSRTLKLAGVGYRAQVAGKQLKLELGFSHPVVYDLPEGVTAQAKSATELVLESCDKQKVGQAAANIRAFRPPEPYKGKGVAYSDEIIRIKETKKK